MNTSGKGGCKSFPIQQDSHLLTVIRYVLRVCRYVERNALRAQLVEQAEQWRWSSAGERAASDPMVPLSEGQVVRPSDRVQWVNATEAEEQMAAIRRSVLKGQPYGTSPWVDPMVAQWGLQTTVPHILCKSAITPTLLPSLESLSRLASC